MATTSPTSERISFQGHAGHELAARLDMPGEAPRAFALFAHCFTCSKDVRAARAVAAELARMGVAVLRFDFTGLGASGGEFASTNFSSNMEDLKRAAGWLRENHRAPELLVGHSLGGAAVLAVAGEIDEVRAVATIGAPGDVEHVTRMFDHALDEIEGEGAAEVRLAGRAFTIERQFVRDLRTHSLKERVAAMRKPLLVLHSPVDDTVGIDNATMIFTAARHPKSFVSLDKADHLLTRDGDAAYAAAVIAGWSARYLSDDTGPEAMVEAGQVLETVRVAETGNGKFQQTVHSGRHRFFADEPVTHGGTDTGPSPYDLVAAGLAACTSMTLRMYFDRKGVEIGRFTVDVGHAKVHAADCAQCGDEQRAKGGRIDRFTRTIAVEGGVPDEWRGKIAEIADKCPVHRTMERSSLVVTTLADPE